MKLSAAYKGYIGIFYGQIFTIICKGKETNCDNTERWRAACVDYEATNGIALRSVAVVAVVAGGIQVGIFV